LQRLHTKKYVRNSYGVNNGRETRRKGSLTFEELLMSNIYTQEALINLLEKKDIIKKKE